MNITTPNLLRITLLPLQRISHGFFTPIVLLITRIPITILNLNLIRLLIRLLKKLKTLGYGRQPILKRKDGIEYSTNQASQLTFHVQSGKRSLTTNLWNLHCFPKVLSKILSKLITIQSIQTLMMIHKLWSLFNHHIQPLQQ